MSATKLHLKWPNAWRARCGAVLFEEVNSPRRVEDSQVFLGSPLAQRCKACTRSLSLDGPVAPIARKVDLGGDHTWQCDDCQVKLYSTKGAARRLGWTIRPRLGIVRCEQCSAKPEPETREPFPGDEMGDEIE